MCAVRTSFLPPSRSSPVHLFWEVAGHDDFPSSMREVLYLRGFSLTELGDRDAELRSFCFEESNLLPLSDLLTELGVFLP